MGTRGRRTSETGRNVQRREAAETPATVGIQGSSESTRKRRRRLKNLWPSGCVGSSPTPGTQGSLRPFRSAGALPFRAVDVGLAPTGCLAAPPCGWICGGPLAHPRSSPAPGWRPAPPARVPLPALVVAQSVMCPAEGVNRPGFAGDRSSLDALEDIPQNMQFARSFVGAVLKTVWAPGLSPSTWVGQVGSGSFFNAKGVDEEIGFGRRARHCSMRRGTRRG